jgi:hypothetical protein
VKQRRTKTKDVRESRGLDFKEQFNPDVPGEWCRLIKDNIVAIANSGGGWIVVGVKDNGPAVRMVPGAVAADGPREDRR